MEDDCEQNPYWKNLEKTAYAASEALQNLSKSVLEGLKPTAGAYAFFNSNAHALTRVEDCKQILRRLCRQKVLLIAVSKEELRAIPNDWPAGTPFPENVQKLMQKRSDLTRLMQIDLESLFMFGMTLLDQWALQIVDANGIDIRKVHPFVELVEHYQAEGDDEAGIWRNLSSEIIWVHYNVRFYRNRFVAHVTRPWQRGTTTGVYRYDFNLHIPTPPGWLNDRELDREILELAPLVTNETLRAQLYERPAALLEYLFTHIGDIETKDDRERISSLFGKKGGSTPSYEQIAAKMLNIVAVSIEITRDYVSTNLDKVRLGAPALDSRALWEQR